MATPGTLDRDTDATMDRKFFGHPAGLSTLFFTEMWERFSYYGMRAILVLFMTAPIAAGGLEMSDKTAGAVYALYTSMVYMMCLPGGWLADRIFGQQRAVLYGGILIASGHYCMAVPIVGTFYMGLCLIVLGTGLLKPNISVIVGQLYGTEDQRRDAGFSIFYMGINIGAFLSPFLIGYLAQDPSFKNFLISVHINPLDCWHFGFGAAGVGMTLGLIQYLLGKRRLAGAGVEPAPAVSPAAAARDKRTAIFGIGGGLALLLLFGVCMSTGVIAIGAEQVANFAGYLLLVIVVVFFGWLLTSKEWTPVERGRLYVIAVYFLASALFWSVFEQAGSTLNYFADRNTDCTILGYTFPSSWFQAINSAFVWMFAPVFAWLWMRLGKAGKEASEPGEVFSRLDRRRRGIRHLDSGGENGRDAWRESRHLVADLDVFDPHVG